MRDFAWIPLALIAALVSDRIAATGPDDGAGSDDARARRVPVGAMAIIVGCAAAAAALKAYDIMFTDGWTRRASSLAAEFTYITAVFTLLGLWAEIAPHARAGWWPFARPALLLGGASIALLALTPESEMEWAAVGVSVVVLSANLFALLGRSTGRASIAFLPCAVALLVPGGLAAPAIGIGLGAVAAFARFDLRGRAHLGSAAAGIGAFLGWGVITRGAHIAWLWALIALAVAHVLTWRPGVDRIFRAG